LVGSGETHEVILKTTFVKQGVECCKSCTCYGDPECVAFSNATGYQAQDAWIPCDSRTDGKCHNRKQPCLAQEFKGQSCQWLAEPGTELTGAYYKMNGSPCQPAPQFIDFENEADRTTMVMYENGGTKVELSLGERGVLNGLILNGFFGNGDLTITPENCFANQDFSAFKLNGVQQSSGSLPSNIKEPVVSASGGLVKWELVSEDDKTIVIFNCIKAVEALDEADREFAAERLNVEEILVSPTDAAASTGFCQAGVIESPGTSAEQKALAYETHRRCVQDKPTALQGCKHLVNWATEEEELEECAVAYCNTANFDAGQKQNCLTRAASSDISAGTGAYEDSFWTNFYCRAIINSNEFVGSQSQCERRIEDGYNEMVETYGTGKRTDDHPIVSSGCSGSCGTSLDCYKIENFQDSEICENGVYIQLLGSEGTFVDKYFIPSRYPVCEEGIAISPEDDLAFFSGPVQITQCDHSGSKTCKRQQTLCDETTGVNFSLSYTNSVRNLVQAVDQGYMMCKPIEGQPDDWCFNGSLPVDKKTCIVDKDESCPNESRRLLGKK